MDPDLHLVLLRGVNVGGRNLLPMAELQRACLASGALAARTYIQSGNALVRLPPAAQSGFAERLRQRLAEEAGVDSPVVLLTVAELAAVRAFCPFPDAGPREVHYALLGALPSPARAASLDPDRSPGDRFVVRHRAVHLHLPNGVARTKLTNVWMDRALGVVSTVRNAATIDALLAMAAEGLPA